MPFVTLSSFVGKYELSITEETGPKIQLYIDRLEVKFLNELFGVELYNLWNGSLDPIYLILNEPFTFQDDCHGIWASNGIADMLTGFIYFEYSRDAYTQQTIDGAQKNTGENSVNSSFVMSNLHGRYADALGSYEAIQRYICKNSLVYPEFRGIRKYTFIPFF
jgi:hypothetical protein